MKAGTVVNMLNMNPSICIFNEAGTDQDFRIESNVSTHGFHLQGSDGSIGIGLNAIGNQDGQVVHLPDDVGIGFGTGANNRPDFQIKSTDGSSLGIICGDGAATQDITISTAGVITANAGVKVDNFTLDGTTLALSSGNFTLDVAGNIILDSDNAFVVMADGGTDIGSLSHGGSGLFEISVAASDADMVFKGNDGGSAITALTFDMSAAGAATFNNDVTAFSDARLKDNVETIPNALEKVCAMRGVNFTRNDNNDQPGTGVIAQEMQEVFPVVVKENDDENNTLSVSYGNLVGVLIEAIKELKQEIDELKGN